MEDFILANLYEDKDDNFAFLSLQLQFTVTAGKNGNWAFDEVNTVSTFCPSKYKWFLQMVLGVSKKICQNFGAYT